ncbi:MAG: hypothetical protein K2G70_00490 [Turicibacter sp.]|nr:hypothetical protein [Turicibacter sp.]
MITEKNIQIPIWDFKVEVCIFDSLEEAQSKYPKFMTDGLLACTVEYLDCSKCKLIIPSNRYSDVVHELEHVKNLVWKAKGYKPHEDNDEPDAYLIGWLFEQVDKLIRKHLATQC